MANFTASQANAIVDAMAARGNSFKLHTGNPGASGTANELVHPGYAPQTGTYVPGATVAGVGAVTQTAQMTFEVSTTPITWMSRWSGSTLVETIDNPDITVNPAGQAKVTHKLTFPNTPPA